MNAPVETIQETKEERSPHLALVILIIILVALGGILYFAYPYIFPSDDDIVNYNGFEFQKENDLWNFVWGGMEGATPVRVPLRYNPLEVENIPLTGTVEPAFETRQIYIAIDPDQNNNSRLAIAATELTISMHQVFGLTPLPACTKNATRCAGKPILDCSNKNESVIMFQDAQTPSVRLADNCIVISGQDWDLVRSTDRFLYTVLYNIMP